MPRTQVSILVPTYNEAPNIVSLLRSVAASVPAGVRAETIVIDDNSPDGTGDAVEAHIRDPRRGRGHAVSVIHRQLKSGLGSAILSGLRQARGETIVVMDGDFSHPPSLIPRLVEAARRADIAVASRYAEGGAVAGWPLRRRLLSAAATAVARRALGVRQKDPLSGFFAFRRGLAAGAPLDGLGYKLLLEMLVKARGARITEVPYTFSDRRAGGSKLGARVACDFARSVWRLYWHRRAPGGHPAAARFASKAARFYTVGASGLAVNLSASLALAGAADLWYLHANVGGILASMTTNFLLNKAWTFGDRGFGARRTASQYAKFLASSSLGALVQMGAVYGLVESGTAAHGPALLAAVLLAASGNFLLNKRWTFGERLWS